MLRPHQNAAQGMFAARNRSLYYAGMLGGNASYQVQSVAVGWHVFSLAHRPFDLGLAGLALFLPTFAFALPAGVYADNHDRRHVIAFTSLLEGLAIAAFAIAVAAHVTALWLYLLILVGIGTAQAFGSPATRALLPSLVPPSEYLSAQATYASLRELVVIGGPALGGLLVAFSTSLALWIAAAGTALTAALLLLVRLERPIAPRAATLRDALDGLRFIAGHKIVLAAISLDLFAVLFGGATALLPAFASGIFHLGAPGFGALRSAPAVGAAIVAAAIARRPIRRNVGSTLLVAVGGFGLATVAFGLSKNFVLSLVLLAIAGGTDMVSVVIRNGLVQLSTPDVMRGRVSAVENVFIGASNQFGDFESGTIAALIGVVPAVVAGGVGTLVVIALWSVLFPGLRHADRFVDEAAAEPDPIPAMNPTASG